MQDTKVNLYPFEQKGEWGYMDEIGNVKIEPKYDIAYYFSDGLALVGMIHRKSENGDWNYYKYGYIDIDGNIAIPIIYDNATPFRNGNAVIERHNYPVKYEKDEDDAYKDWLIKGTRYWIKPNGKFF